MGENLVNAEADEFGIQFLKLVVALLKCHEFRGANRGEIRRMGKQDEPLTPVVIRELNLAVGGYNLKFRKFFSY